MSQLFRLPHDLFQNYFIPRLLLGTIRSEEDLDVGVVPPTILILQFVNKRLYDAIRKCILAWKIILNFRSLNGAAAVSACSRVMGQAAFESGSVELIQWFNGNLKFPLSDLCAPAAAAGFATMNIGIV
jgi:hypothetical protein